MYLLSLIDYLAIRVVLAQIRRSDLSELRDRFVVKSVYKLFSAGNVQ